MALFRLGAPSEISNLVRGEGVYLRPPEPRDYETWSDLREKSRAFLTPWEPTWPGDDLTRTSFRRRLRRNLQEMTSDEAYPFLIFREDDTLVGRLDAWAGEARRRSIGRRSAIGWACLTPVRGSCRGVRAMTGYAFTSLHLHRIEAACLPHNEASIRLLERIGFKREGLARGLSAHQRSLAGPSSLCASGNRPAASAGFAARPRLSGEKCRRFYACGV